MRHYCTLFDIHYAARALALASSLGRHDGDFVLHALCLDEASERLIRGLGDPRIAAIGLSELERGDPRLPVARANRGWVEYCFTLSPFLPLHLLRAHPEIPLVVFVDADCHFHASPRPIFDAFGDDSILVVEHRFAADRRSLLQFGRYNVGLLLFRNDTEGLACLRRWAGQCSDWCHDRVEEGRFADQRYLDDWPEAFRGVHVLGHVGVNLAPWNAGNYRLRRVRGRLWVDDSPLVMYHFHGLQFPEPGRYWPSSTVEGLGAEHIRWLYQPYVRGLARLAARHRIPIGRSLRFRPPDAFARGLRYGATAPISWIEDRLAARRWRTRSG